VNTARSLLLGKLPQAKKGVAVADHYRALRAPWVGSDEGDAVTIGNLHRSLLGMPCMAMPRPLTEKRRSRSVRDRGRGK